MAVTTNARLNLDQLVAQLPADANFTWTGGDLPSTDQKVITPVGTDDATMQAAVDTAAAAFVDYQANQQTLIQKAKTAYQNNQTYLAISSPTNAQVVAQVKALTQQVNGLIRLAAADFSSSS